MTIILTVPSQQYVAPRTINGNFNVPAGTKKLTANLTCSSWPTGEVGTIALTRPDGSAGGGATFVGGAVDRNGQPRTSVEFFVGDPAGLAAGQWGIQIDVLQTITTAITVDRE